MTAYVLDNHHRRAADHHAALAELLDPYTRARIRALDSWPRTRRCLEVGAGAGSIACWLADQVGPDGEVVAIDLKPDHIAPHPRLTTVAHDLTGFDPLPEAVTTRRFDLIHARLTLAHLPAREAVLRRLAGLLAPDGMLLVQDWAPLRDGVVVAAPNRPAAELYQRYQHAVGGAFDRAGTDRGWARRIHPSMANAGLADVETQIHGRYWTGGDPGTRLVAAVAAQLRPQLLAAGLTETQLGVLAELLHDPLLVVHGHPLYSTSGRNSREISPRR